MLRSPLMKIVQLSTPEKNVIAFEEQFGEREGWFELTELGKVVYRHRLDEDDREWFAGDDVAQFRLAATAWNRYSADAAGRPDSEQSVAIDRLRSELERIGAFADRDDCLWSVLMEQVDDGLL
jgi:hypothetical protein